MKEIDKLRTQNAVTMCTVGDPVIVMELEIDVDPLIENVFLPLDAWPSSMPTYIYTDCICQLFILFASLAFTPGQLATGYFG